MNSDDASYGERSRRNLHKNMDELFPQQEPSSCRVCNEPVVDGRWNYCSERCREIAQGVQKMFSWNTIREKVLERDDYTCQRCGLSKEMAARAYRQSKNRAKELTNPLREEDTERGVRAYWHMYDRYSVESPFSNFFHVDHIQRIADGGHKFDEANLETLCKHCHAEKTAEENSGRQRQHQTITLQDYIES